jgi:TPR repeat protein/uncharacterized caspase-like protein
MRALRRLLSVLAIVGLAALCASAPARADKRVALVIGNSAYRNVPRLGNPTNDARLIARTLRQYGFDLVGGDAQVDLDKAHFDAALQSFSNQVQGADVALFYYAGHGLQVGGRNFLVPIEANPTREADIYLQMVDTSIVLSQMEGAGTKLNIVLLDACRNSPFGGRGLRAAAGGLAQMQAPEGTLISYATQPGNIALDGADGDSPYTLALADTIRRPGLGLFDVFNQVGLAVKRATGGVQQPWVSSSPIEGGFYFAGSTPVAAVNSPAAPESAATKTAAPGAAVAVAAADPAARKTVSPGAVAALEPQTTGDPQAGSPTNRAESPAEACDRLAAAPIDRSVPNGVVSVKFDDLDPVKALPSCRAAVAAQPDNARLVYELGRAVLKGGGEEEAMVLFRKAAVAGNAAAMNSLAYAYENGKGLPVDLAMGLQWYRKSADAGNGASMHELGWIYQKGAGVPADPAEALRWFRKAADAGNSAGMVDVGEAYARGRGVPKNPAEAARWYTRAAEAGNSAGMNHLGAAYFDGFGVGRDLAEAMRWFRRAADAGNRIAMRRLGDAYMEGVGVGVDKAEAERWYRRAKE